MKTLKGNILALLLLLVGLCGCQESQPDHFKELEGVYLNNRLANNTLIDTTSITFIYEDKDYIEVPVSVQLLGRTSDIDRPIDLRVSSKNAVLGTDYELPDNAILPSGHTKMDYIITLKRTSELKKEVKSLIVELFANDSFTVPFSYQIQSSGDTTSVVRFKIDFSDQFTAPPVGWKTMFVGTFTQQKFELLCDVLEIPRADFNETDKISFAKWMFLQSQMTYYIMDQQQKKAAGEPFDKRAFDESGNPLSYTK